MKSNRKQPPIPYMEQAGRGGMGFNPNMSASRGDNSSLMLNNSGFGGMGGGMNFNNDTSLTFKEFLGKVNKLSNKGWSYNLRLLKMDQYALTYYKNVPSDFDERTMKSQQFEDGKIKVKQSIPIKRIISIDDIKEDDKKKHKKLAKAPDIAFKVVFPKKYMVKGREYNPEEDDPQEESEDEDDLDEDSGDDDGADARTKMRKSKNLSAPQVRSKSKGGKTAKNSNMSTWYFVCESKYHQQLWMERLISQSRAQNSRFIADESVIARLVSNQAAGKANQTNLRGLQDRQGGTSNFGGAMTMEQSEDDEEEDDEEDMLPQKHNNKRQQQQPPPQKVTSNKQQNLGNFNTNNPQSVVNPSKIQHKNEPPSSIKQPQKQAQVNQQQQFQQQQNQRKPPTAKQDFNEMGRTDSEFPDLDQVIYQNLQINNVKIDGDGNIDQTANQKSSNNPNMANGGNLNGGEDSDGEQFIEDSKDAKERLRKLQENVNSYYKQATELQQKKSKKEEKGWDLKFQNYWCDLITADKNLKDSMTLSERFFSHVGKFRRTAQQLVKEIVDELHLPPNHHSVRYKHQPVQKIQEEHMVFLDDEDSAVNNAGGTLFYFEKNICIKITHQGDKMLDAGGLGAGGQNNPGTANATAANRTSNNMQNSVDQSYMGPNQQNQRNADPFQNLKWKMYGREFLSMDVMFDALFLLSKPEASHKLRVPLSALVDYKGFRAVAIACIPIYPQQGPSIGFFSDGKYVPHDQKLKQELIYVGDVLNLKENRISQKGYNTTNTSQQNVRQFESVPVSFFVKVYNHQLPDSKDSLKDMDTPTMKSQEYHFSELQYLEKPFYVLKTSEIFPYDVDLDEVYPRKDKYLRPEFVCTYERPLKADARKDLGIQLTKDTKSKDDDNDQVELNEASRYLKYVVIPNLVNLLDSLIIMPIDSESLTTCFHSQGVNIRYLGLVCQNSTVPHVQQICKVEMIARALKNILNKQLSAMVLDHQKRFQENSANIENHRRQWNTRQQMSGANISKGKRGNMSSMQAQQQEYELKEKELQEEHEELCKDLDITIKQSIVDFINLVFGNGDESREFWTQVLVPYTIQYFNLPSDEMLRPPFYINYNAIFFSFIYHAGIKIVSQHVQSQMNGLQAQQSQALDMLGAGGRLGGGNQLGEKMQDRLGNALLQQQQQLMMQQKDDDFFKEFGKSEMPFGQPERAYQRIELVPKSKTFSMRNLPYKLLSDKYKEYKDEGQIENALKCCKMRRVMKRSLEDKEDVSTLAEICEIALDNYEYKIAKDQAMEALKYIHPLHAESIKFYCILMRAFHGMEFFQEQDQYFTKGLNTLGHHWGHQHPLHCTIFGIMAYLLIQKNKLEEAQYLYNSSHICCLKVLGSNHIQTAEVHMDFGRLHLKMKNKDAALEHFQNAYLIYESYFGVQSLSTAQVAQQLANILEEQGKLNEAFTYADIASDTYPTIYGDTNEKSITSHWLKLSISYSLKKQDVLQQCRKLYEAILKRDYQYNEHSGMDYSQDKQSHLGGQGGPNGTSLALHQNDKNADYINDKLQAIKEYCIATTILEMTRSLSREDRLVIKMFCDKVLFKAHQLNEQGIPNLSDLQQQINPSKVMHVSNLRFDEEGKAFFETLYQVSKDYEGGFAAFYQKTIDSAIHQMNEAKKQTNLQASSTVKPSRGADQNLLSEFLSFGEGPDEFFKRTIKAFERYNFYNVLLL